MKNSNPTSSLCQGEMQKSTLSTRQYPPKSPLIMGTGRRAFTLVELIIVITILAILATIAFMSFQGYVAQSRDSNRLATVKNVSSGIDVFFTKAGAVPLPDSVEYTGSFSGVVFGEVGTIGETVTRQVVMNEIPKDPRSALNYMYGIDAQKRFYQIGYQLEGGLSMILGQSSYASEGDTAQVLGNYTYPYRHDDMLYSLPSLLYTGTGNLEEAQYIVDGGQNIPGGVNRESLTQSLVYITGFSGLTLTGVQIPTITISEYKNALGIPRDFESLSGSLGITGKDKIGALIFGEKYFSTQSTSDHLKWRDLDTNCHLGDIEIINSAGKIIQTWAGCNSTLGSGKEWGDTGASGCKNYISTGSISTDCMNTSMMASDKSERSWSVATPVSGTTNNIWGKIYLRTGAITACGSGRHLPSDDEFVELENFFWRERLGNNEDCRLTNTGAGGDEWRCENLGYSGATSRNRINSLSNTLNIPLAGFFLSSRTPNPFDARGSNAYFWTSSVNALKTRAYLRDFNILHNDIGRRYLTVSHGFSVRCIKD